MLNILPTKLVKNSLFATAIGFLGILCWSTNPLAISHLNSIPPYQLVATILGVYSLITVLKLTLTREWRRLKIHPKHWIMSTVAFGGMQVSLLFAFKNAPPEHVELILYLWPIQSLILGALFLHEKISWIMIVPALTSLGGLALLVSAHSTDGTYAFVWQGYLLAFLAGLLWASFNVYSKHVGQIPHDLLGIAAGVASLLTWILHFFTEETVLPTLLEAGAIIYIAMAVNVIGYYFWVHAVRWGRFALLNTIANFTPTISVILLVSFGFASWSIELGLATLLVLGSCVASGILEAKRKSLRPVTA